MAVANVIQEPKGKYNITAIVYLQIINTSFVVLTPTCRARVVFVATKVQLATQIFCGVRTKVQLAWNVPAYGLSFHRGQLAAALLSGNRKKTARPLKAWRRLFSCTKRILWILLYQLYKKSRARAIVPFFRTSENPFVYRCSRKLRFSF